MFAIMVYDVETGHVETLTQVASAEAADGWLARFRSGGTGANDVVYVRTEPANGGTDRVR